MNFFAQILLIAFIVLPTNLYAKAETFEQPDSQTLLLRYITRNDDYKDALKDQVKRLFALSIPACTENPTQKRLKPTTIETLRFPKLEEADEVAPPGYGQWIERIQLSACGTTIQHNFLATAHDVNTIPLLLPLLNGQSRIQPIDQHRAEDIVKNSIRDAGCSEAAFTLGTRFLGYKAKNQQAISPTNQNAGWFEEWIVDACSKTESVNVAVLPDAQSRVRFFARVKSQEAAE